MKRLSWMMSVYLTARDRGHDLVESHRNRHVLGPEHPQQGVRLGPIFEKIFAAFVNAGYVAFSYGGAEVGKYLT